MVKTQEELLEELLEEVRQTRRYAEEMHASSTYTIRLVERILEEGRRSTSDDEPRPDE